MFRTRLTVALSAFFGVSAALAAITEADNDTGSAINGGNVTLNFTALEDDYAFVLNCDADSGGDNALSVVTSGYTVVPEISPATTRTGKCITRR